MVFTGTVPSGYVGHYLHKLVFLLKSLLILLITMLPDQSITYVAVMLVILYVIYSIKYSDLLNLVNKLVEG